MRLGSGVTIQISETLDRGSKLYLASFFYNFVGIGAKIFTAQWVGQQGSETLVTCSIESL